MTDALPSFDHTTLCTLILDNSILDDDLDDFVLLRTDGIPLYKGPYSRVTAYDLNAGTIGTQR